MSTHGYSAYQRSAMMAPISQGELLIRLYEGAIRFVNLARQSFDRHDVAAKGKYISKTLAIISELDCALDHSIGGEMTENLTRLYRYVIDGLTDANIQNDPSGLIEVENLLQQLLQAFKTAQQDDLKTSPVSTAPAPSSVSKGLNVAI